MSTPRSAQPGVSLLMTSGVELVALTVHILESGWLRIHWADDDFVNGRISYVSPHAVREMEGEGVIYSDE